MKINTFSISKGFFELVLFLFVTNSVSAQHFLGGELTYAHLTGNTYQLKMKIYVKCDAVYRSGPSLMSTATPQVCVYDGSTLIASRSLIINDTFSALESGMVCPGLITQCTSAVSDIPAMEQYVYADTITLPYRSATWRFIYNGNDGPGAAATRMVDITNIGTTASLIQLTDTLNNSTADNSTPDFFHPISVYYTDSIAAIYDPAVTDPDGDSLSFALVAAENGTSTCGSIGGAVSYTGTAWTSPVTAITPQTPLNVFSDSFSLNAGTGKMSFDPNATQVSVVDYCVREYRSGVLIGTSKREMVVNVLHRDSINNIPCAGIVIPVTELDHTCGSGYLFSLSGPDNGCGIGYQWEQSLNGITWSAISGATLETYAPSALVSGYYRATLACSISHISAASAPLFIPPGFDSFYCAIPVLMDTNCTVTEFHNYTCNSAPSLSVKTSYGDGTNDDLPLSYAASPYSIDFLHRYSMPGTYTVKQVLHNATTNIDSATFSYENTYCHTLSVAFYTDFNLNGIFDSGDMFCDVPVTIEVDSNGIPLDTISVLSGLYYKAFGPIGTVYDFRLISADDSLLPESPSSGILSDTISALPGPVVTRYFGLRCGGSTGFDLSEYTLCIMGPHAFEIRSLVSNHYCADSASALLNIVVGPGQNVAGIDIPSRPPSTYSNDTVAVAFADLHGGASQTFVSGVFEHRPMLWIGDTVIYHISIGPIIGDMDTSNNNSTVVDTVTSSYDPNEIAVNPHGYVSAGTTLQYTIGFENTGNAPAQNIYVLDTLPDQVIPSTMKMKAASATMNIFKTNDGLHNIVKFDFPGINLLDSSHHGQCDGMLVFTIDTKNGLPDGTLIDNRAGIYFDDNPVVMTNTAEDIIGTPPTVSGVAVLPQDKVSVFPNPAKSQLTIYTSGVGFSSYTIINAIGVEQMEYPITATHTTVDVKALPEGVYYVILKSDAGPVVKKFVKM
jgi:uncharacterized repeat protein (TIGR01451 family)